MRIRYLQAHSLTWWAGVLSVGIGGAGIAGLDHPAYGQIATVISTMLGGTDASPASLIVLGFGLIGIRDKLSRMEKSE
jgi:hypothetical protein